MGVFMSIYWINTDDLQALLMENMDTILTANRRKSISRMSAATSLTPISLLNFFFGPDRTLPDDTGEGFHWFFFLVFYASAKSFFLS